MLKVTQVASRLSLSLSKVYELIDGGKLGHHRMDGAIRVSEEQLRAYLDATEKGPGDAPERQRPQRPRLRHIKI